MRLFKNTFKCSVCLTKQTELYAGETWEPGDYIQESWWKGESSPICTVCSLERTLETFVSFKNAHEFLGMILDAT